METYELKGGEYVRNRVLFGWTGRKCEPCNGTGEGDDETSRCAHCGGTGDEYGIMPIQPANLPPDTE